MPFASRRQQRWAFANKKPFAKRWAKETPSFAALPETKDAGTTAGAPLAGPGGLLGYPGQGRTIRKRFKAMTRSEAASVAAHARWDKTPRKAKPPLKGRKPAKTEQEREQARQTRRTARQGAHAAEQAKQRADVLRSLNIAPDGQRALEALRQGNQPDPAALARGGFVAAGLVEQARDGTYRMTPAGRALLSAADAGDRGRAGDTISGGRDRTGARAERQAAAAERKKKPKQASGGSKKKHPTPKHPAARPMTRAERRRQRAIARMMRPRQAAKSFLVYKSADGAPRWLARTTTAYRDRDREIIAIKTLDADSQRMTAARQFGPLRWWHVGQPDPDARVPWGPGLDIGDCDFSIQIGTTRVESGTFKSAVFAQRIAATADQYELSPGFFHPLDQPYDGVYADIRTFERSLVPIKYGRASNLFTGLTVKEFRMDMTEQARRFNTMVESLELTPEQSQAMASVLTQTDKSARATIDPVTGRMGIAYKSDDAAQIVVINGITYKAEAAPEPPAAEPPPDVIINGITYKAVPPEFLDQQEEDKALGDPVADDGMDMGGEMDGMDDNQLIAAIADAVVAKIAPMFGDMKLSEFKALMSGMSQKDAGRAQEIATLKAEQAKLAERLTQLTGDQPSVIIPAEVEAALKGAPAAPPDPSQPQIPADATPLQHLAARTMPQLYQVAPNGQFNGWTPPQPS